jgi:hypothetical protein
MSRTNNGRPNRLLRVALVPAVPLRALAGRTASNMRTTAVMFDRCAGQRWMCDFDLWMRQQRGVQSCQYVWRGLLGLQGPRAVDVVAKLDGRSSVCWSGEWGAGCLA